MIGCPESRDDADPEWGVVVGSMGLTEVLLIENALTRALQRLRWHHNAVGFFHSKNRANTQSVFSVRRNKTTEHQIDEGEGNGAVLPFLYRLDSRVRKQVHQLVSSNVKCGRGHEEISSSCEAMSLNEVVYKTFAVDGTLETVLGALPTLREPLHHDFIIRKRRR
ncbi:hypothetical protein CROQUDRAFT_105881 [Cronartium quercuum f. sp. fusiforme G11]|uniref:Uncharacterized protein n=1 Tax=Cronartium quercuum f. sp. fusiforme G11 TaxID=708437 RepID=A0A9P6NQD4_9BASI|nr:hypothetical protein CROQUDRAFT_105881 [Cronartium quercuum f. sp. fusiforme G11]